MRQLVLILSKHVAHRCQLTSPGMLFGHFGLVHMLRTPYAQTKSLALQHSAFIQLGKPCHHTCHHTNACLLIICQCRSYHHPSCYMCVRVPVYAGLYRQCPRQPASQDPGAHCEPEPSTVQGCCCCHSARPCFWEPAGYIHFPTLYALCLHLLS